MQYYSPVDIVLLPLYLIVIFSVARLYVSKMVVNDPAFRFFIPGLLFKIIGGLGLAFVYLFYYPGGDTTSYFGNAMILSKLAVYDFDSFWHVFWSKANTSLYSYFNSETGYPMYLRDTKTWTVVRIAFVLSIFSFQSFLVTTVLCAVISFSGIWKLYRVFVYEFPHLKGEMAIAFLFIPSVFFWGSGLLKDTFTMAAFGYLIYAMHSIIVRRHKIIGSLIIILLSSYAILTIKPYILVGFLPALILWIVQLNLQKIKAQTVRVLTLPLLLLIAIGFGYLVLFFMGDALADYKLTNILEKARTTQRDLKSEHYMGNSFDIGDFEANVSSILGKFPAATFSAIFRPLIFEANNVVMFLSGLENLLILLFTIRVLFTVGIGGVFNSFFRHGLLTFSLFFSVFFAFSVGLTTSNFGSLVRYKIPCIPFFIAALFLIRHFYRADKTAKTG